MLFNKKAKKTEEEKEKERKAIAFLDNPVYQAQQAMLGLTPITSASFEAAMKEKQEAKADKSLGEIVKEKRDGTYGLTRSQIKKYQNIADYFTERGYQNCKIGYEVTLRDMSDFSDEGKIIRTVTKGRVPLKLVRAAAEHRYLMLVGYGKGYSGREAWDAYSGEAPDEVTSYSYGAGYIYDVSILAELTQKMRDEALRRDLYNGRNS